MKAVYTDMHTRHAPAEITLRGLIAANLEVPGRAQHLLKALQAGGHEIVAPRDFGMEPILAIHDPDYIEFLRTAYTRWHEAFPEGKAGPYACSHASANRHRASLPTSIQGQVGYFLSGGSAPIDEGTYEAALASANCALETVKLLEEGQSEAYALCRPPGHHAYADMAGGFCYLNNAAIAAQALLATHKRVAILDFDVHHGNGTQDIFYHRDDVHFVSVHGDPNDLFPFYVGYADERGEGAGEGYNLNLPVPLNSGDDVYLAAIDAAIDSVKKSGATALVVSVGFDAFSGDPSAEMNVSTGGFEQIGARLGAAGLPTALIQEGGYLVADLGLNLEAFMRGFVAAR